MPQSNIKSKKESAVSELAIFCVLNAHVHSWDTYCLRGQKFGFITVILIKGQFAPLKHGSDVGQNLVLTLLSKKQTLRNGNH